MRSYKVDADQHQNQNFATIRLTVFAKSRFLVKIPTQWSQLVKKKGFYLVETEQKWLFV